MKYQLTDRLINMLTAGNRPIRIFVFGGALFAYLIMQLAGKLLGVETRIDDGADLLSILLMIASILVGYGISYSIMVFLENARLRQEDQDSQD